MRRSICAAIAVLLAFSAAEAQTTAPAKFEAASVKLNVSVGGGIGNKFDPERFSYTNVPLRVLVENLYRLKDYQIIGAPGWFNSDKWDITAKSEGPTSMDQKFEMAKTLLAEHFDLKFHFETREFTVYKLSVLNGGPKFQEPAADARPGMRIGTGSIIGTKLDVSALANLLSGQLNVPVIDTAGLKGQYDFKLEWTPGPNESNFRSSSVSTDPAALDPAGPSIFTAVQEQLGLKLEKSKGPVNVLVIDQVIKPAGN